MYIRYMRFWYWIRYAHACVILGVCQVKHNYFETVYNVVLIQGRSNVALIVSIVAQFLFSKQRKFFTRLA